MKNNNNQLIILLFIFVWIFFAAKPIYAQIGAGNMVPGVDCGNAQASDAKAKQCCKKMEVNANGLPINTMPIVGELFEYMTKSNRSDNNIPCIVGVPSDKSNPNNCVCLDERMFKAKPVTQLSKICDQYYIFQGSKLPEYDKCQACAGKNGVWTSVGCIEGNVRSLIEETFFGWGIGIAGGLALLCIIYSAFQMQTSQGNAEKIKKSQEMLTSCIMGLMLIIFSVLILRLIGVSVLRLPGLSN